MILALNVRDESAMARLGAAVAHTLAPGDRIALIGDLGAGKTTLARGVLRALSGDPALEVPSPTFTLVQSYDGRVPVRHVDLYRLADASEAHELGLGDGAAAELIEWPTEALPIKVSIAFATADEARSVEVDGPEPWVARLAREWKKQAFVAAAGWADAVQAPLHQDASTRNYDRLVRQHESAVLMDAPSFDQPKGSYAATARLADGNNEAFLAVGAFLREAGLSAPAVIHADPAEGFILLEDLGDEKIARDGRPVPERYLAAADALAALHQTPLPERLPYGHVPPRLDADLGLFEVALFPRWYMEQEADQEFFDLWRVALEGLWRGDEHLALRDYHSPNCLWLENREGFARVGLIDYQDAMIAPSPFDVVSLAQDARIGVDDELQEAIVTRYLAARPGLDEARWREAYSIIGAQRATRIAGVFSRLNTRDGKPQYLAHLPNVIRALSKNLAATPALAPLADWYARHLGSSFP
ncbi:MAG: tRNA (adenosine(37)-N6)-threonylcarbamoyltransferase complex ATPase subunit type 1 TsaE [Pseudomonadota bacterium]